MGQDIQSIEEFREKSALLNSLAFFSKYEHQYVEAKPKPISSLTGIICAKEAFIKALSGIPNVPKYSFSDFEIKHLENGRPYVCTYNNLEKWCKENNLKIDISISHSSNLACATAVLFYFL